MGGPDEHVVSEQARRETEGLYESVREWNALWVATQLAALVRHRVV